MTTAHMLLWVLAWYGIGILGCALGIFLDWWHGKDLQLEDMIACSFVSGAGPIVIIVVIGTFISTCSDFVILKGRKQNDN